MKGFMVLLESLDKVLMVLLILLVPAVVIFTFPEQILGCSGDTPVEECFLGPQKAQKRPIRMERSKSTGVSKKTLDELAEREMQRKMEAEATKQIMKELLENQP